jgi:hypothetical protein
LLAGRSTSIRSIGTSLIPSVRDNRATNKLAIRDETNTLGEEVNKASLKSELSLESETIWIVGHGSPQEIGDKSIKGVILTAGYIVSVINAIVVMEKEKYKGSIVIDNCSSAVKDDDGRTLADQVYEKLRHSFPNATVGGWIGSAKGPISNGHVQIGPEVFTKEQGFRWGGKKEPLNTDHTVLAKLI